MDELIARASQGVDPDAPGAEGTYDYDEDGDLVRGLFLVSHEIDGTAEWQVRDGRLLVSPADGRHRHLDARPATQACAGRLTPSGRPPTRPGSSSRPGRP